MYTSQLLKIRETIVHMLQQKYGTNKEEENRIFLFYLLKS
jgi:hypothetical protein